MISSAAVRCQVARLGAVLLLAWLSACGRAKPKAPTAGEIAEFETVSGIKLPASASALAYLEESGGPDRTIWIAVKLPDGDVPSLVPAALTDGRSWKTASAYELSLFKRLSGSLPPTCQFVEALLPKGRVLKILIDKTDATTPTAYFMWFTT